jgi:hypothetical protein
MRESDLGTLLKNSVAVAGWKFGKLHNDEFQVGYPDYLCWKENKPFIGMELKILKFTEDKNVAAKRAIGLLTRHQRSLMESMATSTTGVLLVYGDELKSDGKNFYYLGIAKLKRNRGDLDFTVSVCVQNVFSKAELETAVPVLFDIICES